MEKATALLEQHAAAAAAVSDGPGPAGCRQLQTLAVCSQFEALTPRLPETGSI